MSKVDVPQDLMTYQEASDALGITLQSVRTAVAEHRLHSVKLPGHIHRFIRRAEIADYRRRNRSTEASEAPVSAPLVPVAQLPAEQVRSYAQAFAAPIADHYGNMADRAVPGMIAAVLGGFQVLQGQQPTLDPKALAV